MKYYVRLGESMNYIKKLKIKGLKKFKNFEIEFNKNLNVLIGENEVGKSTILNAIDIVLNQKYRSADKYIVKEMLNIENVKKFKKSNDIKDLPKVEVELFMVFNDNEISTLDYKGQNNSDGIDTIGIKFICEFDNDYGEELKEQIVKGKIPYEYYNLKWETFAKGTYKAIKKPIKSVTIDNSNIDTSNSFNYYNKMLFNNAYDSSQRIKIKDSFRNSLNDTCSSLDLKISDSNSRSFGVNEKKVIFENIVSIVDGGILLENKGKGQENLVKTEIAIDKKKDILDLVLIEEPENHLSHTNLRKMINKVQSDISNGQVILTTHNNLIVNKLNLNNVMWITENRAKALRDLNNDDADFFEKAPNNNILQFILAEKVLLVEGPTECVLIPKIYEKNYNENIDDINVDIISCAGVTYKRYIKLAKQLNKKVAILTDNDESKENIKEFEDFNNENTHIQIFSDNDVKNWTWEVCFYNLNKTNLENLIEVQNRQYKFKGKSYQDNKVLGKMLNNKTDTAIAMLKDMDINDYEIPKYIKEALVWIKG